MELLASAKWVLGREGVKTEEKYMLKSSALWAAVFAVTPLKEISAFELTR